MTNLLEKAYLSVYIFSGIALMTFVVIIGLYLGSKIGVGFDAITIAGLLFALVVAICAGIYGIFFDGKPENLE